MFHSFRPSPTTLPAILFFCMGCGGDKNVPFPIGEPEFRQPVSRPFQFTEPVPVEWETVNANVQYSTPQPFELDNFTARPFDIGGPKPLPAPVEQRPFDWNSVPDTAFNLEDLPSRNFTLKTTPLQRPRIVKAGNLHAAPGSTRGIMEAGFNLGLPGDARAFLKDPSGATWIATTRGLCLFDGVHVEIYGFEEGLVDPNLWSISRDNKGRIWVGSGNGQVYILDKQAGVMHHLKDHFPTGAIYFMMRDRDGNMWFNRAGQGVFIADIESQIIRFFNPENGLLHAFNIKAVEDRDGMIWITSSRGVNVIDKINGRNYLLTSSHGLSDNSMAYVFIDSKDRTWLAGNDGNINVLDSEKLLISTLGKEHGIPEERITGIFEDSSGTIWIGTMRGKLFGYDDSAQTLDEYVVDADGTSIYIFNFLEDMQHQIWLGTAFGKSYLLKRNLGQPGNLSVTDGLHSTSIWSTAQDTDDNIWIGADGIDVVNTQERTIVHLDDRVTRTSNYLNSSGDGNIWLYRRGRPTFSFVDVENKTIQHLDMGINNMRADRIYATGSGEVFIVTTDGKVYHLNGKVLRQLIDETQTGNPRGYDLVLDQNNQLWVAYGDDLNGGVSVYDVEKNTMKRLTAREGLLSDFVYSVALDDQHNIWIGTARGVNMVDLQNSTITSITVEEGLVNNEIWLINTFERDVYVGTSAGLSIITPPIASETWNILTLGRPQGLSAVDFDQESGVIDRQGRFWAGVDTQILTIIDRPEKDAVKPFCKINGISIQDKPRFFYDRNKIQEIINQTDTLWRPDNGQMYENTASILDSGYMQMNGIEWEGVTSSFSMPIDLRLPHDQNYLSFTYTAIDMSNPDQVKYRYILEGIDKNWSPIISENESESYRDLPPGKYTFKVASKGINGIWSEPASFSFTITPPWWFQWWAYVIYFVLFSIIIYFIVQIRSYYLKKENRLLEERVNHRTAQLNQKIEELKSTQTQLIHSEKMASLGELTAGIAHEIQNPLNFVNNFSDINRELVEEMIEEMKKGNLEEAERIGKDLMENEGKIVHHGKRAEEIVRSMLQHSRGTEGKKEPTDLNVLADEYLRLAYHGMRARDKSFNVSMETDLDPTIREIEVVPQDIGRVVLNLITNAFHAISDKQKASDNGFKPVLALSTRKNRDFVEIKVKDNGPGIPDDIRKKIFQPFFTTKSSGEGTGLGLSLSYDIVTKGHGGTLDMKSEEGKGTEFIISLPYSGS